MDRPIILAASRGLVAKPTSLAGRVVGPGVGQIERTVDEGMAVTRHVAGEHPDLAVRNLARRARVLPRHSARCLALLEKAGFIDHQNRILVRKVLDDIVAHDVAQRIRFPPVPTQKRLLPPRTGVAGRLSAHPPGLATLITKQTVQEKPRVYRRTLLRKQRLYPSLHLPQR